MFASPKKYHPMIVENAKNNIQIAIKISPNLPYKVENAYWLSCAPVKPVVLDPVVIITSAVRLRITNVSMNTPIIATKPCSTGWFTFATACACGVEPIPASLEKRPLATPFCTASFKVAPIAPPATAAGLNAPTIMSWNAAGIAVTFAKITIKEPTI